MACSGCRENNSVPEPANKLTRAEAIALRNQKQGYTKTSTFTVRSVAPTQKAQKRAKNKAKLKGK